MFQKVRFQMFFLCGCITSLVLLGMALFTLSISEGNLRENHYQSFQQDITTMSYNLEQQVVITHQWLKNIESQGKYTLYVIDNHTPYLFNVLNSTEDEVRLFEKAYMHYQDSFSIASNNLTAFTILHDEFTFRDSLTRKQYYASILLLERNANPLEILVLANTEDLLLQITNQRITFSFIILFALLCLWIFSYLFTSIILKPLQKNQEEQVAFISAASHELRTPLAVIQSYLSAQEKGTLPDGAPFFTMLKNESFRIYKTVEILLFLSCP